MLVSSEWLAPGLHVSICHSACRPNSQETGPFVLPPFNETWAAMESLVDQGLVRSIGVSNFSPEKIKSILKSARIKPAVNQVRMHQHGISSAITHVSCSRGQEKIRLCLLALLA